LRSPDIEAHLAAASRRRQRELRLNAPRPPHGRSPVDVTRDASQLGPDALHRIGPRRAQLAPKLKVLIALYRVLTAGAR
jgi:hypothetical protein